MSGALAAHISTFSAQKEMFRRSCSAHQYILCAEQHVPALLQRTSAHTLRRTTCSGALAAHISTYSAQNNMFRRSCSAHENILCAEQREISHVLCIPAMRSGVPESNVPALQAVFLCAAHAAAARSTLMYGGAEGHATVGRMNARRALREHKAKQDHKKPWFSNFFSPSPPSRARAR